MGYFKDFKRRAVVVIPPHHELRKRSARRAEETGAPVPTEAVDAMKGEHVVCSAEGGRKGVGGWVGMMFCVFTLPPLLTMWREGGRTCSHLQCL